MAGANGVRLRTNMRMSPARMGRFSDASISAESSQPRMVWAMRPASRPTGEEALASASGDQGSVGLACSDFSVGQISISPACPARWAT